MYSKNQCRPPAYYRWLIWLVRPLYRLFLWSKRHTLDDYNRQISDRFVRDVTPVFANQRVIWCHAVSLGELNTAYRLLDLLIDDGYFLYITSTTQTGYNRVKTLFAHKNQRVAHGFVPIDDVKTIERFIGKIRPKAVMFIETELWANTLFVLNKHAIPSIMINARLTKRSFDRYQQFAKLSQSMMCNLSFVVAQDALSVSHFLQLGLAYQKVAQADSLKWVIDTKKTKSPPNKRFVWTAGSTHDNEEQICLSVHQKLCEEFDNPLLIIVPRHPERFECVYELCVASGLKVGRESQGIIGDDTQVYLVDSMGQLMAYYGRCDVAFVGGSMIDKGGHTPIEPLSLAKPVIMGQYTKNTQVLLDELDQSVQIVKDSDELYEMLSKFLINPKKAIWLGRLGQNIVLSKQNAHLQQKQYLDRLLP